MKEWIYKIIIVVMAIILLWGASSILYSTGNSPSSLSKINLKNKIVENYDRPNITIDEMKIRMDSIYEIAQNVSNSHNYSDKYPNIFDCTDFSKELIRELTENGYDSRCVFGTFDGSSHTWVIVSVRFRNNYVEVPVEATSGEFIGYHEYMVYYNKISEEKCI